MPSPLSFDLELAICTLLVFFLMLAVLGKFAWKPIVAALEERERNISDNIASFDFRRRIDGAGADW